MYKNCTLDIRPRRKSYAVFRMSTTNRIINMQERLREWDNKHTKLNGAPTPNGRNYLAHASGLLLFLEPISELNSAAKVVVGCFKTLLTLEQDRQENEARIAVVFLAVADVLRVLVNVDDLRPQGSLATNFDRVLKGLQDEVNACGNSVDTYYKELRLVKFFKSQDWKKRISGHIKKFDKCRLDLHEALAVQTAFGVDDLGKKLDFLLAGLFASKHGWEKALDKASQGLGPPSAWINNPGVLRDLISVTEDPALFMPTPDENANSLMKDIVNSWIEKVQKDLQLSLDDQCANNREWFEMKLNLQAERTHAAIENSAQRVIETLSGPYDRLKNEDLKELWKEMNWIFCVETKMFTKALLEYYVDRFSISPQHHVEEYAANNVSTSTSSSNLPLLSRHADFWTLEYIAQDDEIGRAVDSDGSGYVRISEANSLTARMPEGYNLPQWCAYSVGGWSYENRVYRSRIAFLLLKLAEMQASVVPANAKRLSGCVSWILYSVCHAFCRQPQGQGNRRVPPELHELVKERIRAQDADLRAKLNSLNWTIPDESAFQLLLREEPLEKYILPFCTLMLEYTFKISNMGTSYTIAELDWDRIRDTFLVVRSICRKRIFELKDVPQDIATYSAGLWSLFEIDPKEGIKSPSYTVEEDQDYLSDLSQVAADFPLPPTTGVQPYLQQPPQESEARASPYRFEGIEGWSCNRCKTEPVDKRRNCLYCPDFDLCQSCYACPGEDHSVEVHTYQHPISLQSILLNTRQTRLMLLPDALTVMSRLGYAVMIEEYSLDAGMTATEKDEYSTLFGFHHTCYQCEKPLSLDFTLYVCIGHMCRDYFLCQECAQKEHDEDAGAEHHWWHTLLEVRKDVILPEGLQQRQSEDSDNSSGDDITSIIDKTKNTPEKTLELNHAKPEEQTSALVVRLGSVEERISRLEGKMDTLLSMMEALLETHSS
ncbi:hypothetical protein GALMADRAFT_458592 [Galerina marginata CBS 339.88]|uniref:ZZ-type domain-containing protein n=1 Tax=Galerina marginata (strain CBS 339.88) TaxID=685588 RepID=A0A067SYL7_GALM3|nr:hypothetical protein GALMADRAFT_458592 [Galerina marginata CBS 339.88]